MSQETKKLENMSKSNGSEHQLDDAFENNSYEAVINFSSSLDIFVSHWPTLFFYFKYKNKQTKK